jgi:4-hydroxyphenylpyruvate dioxygenase
VTRSKDFSVQIPFNEAADDKSQIQEYISLHKGPGVQHIAILTDSCLKTMDSVKSDKEAGLEFLDVPETYYEVIGKRVKIKEDLKDLSKHRLLVDQDEKGGYLIQIFTKNLFGPIFMELIQREGNIGFGEGNFQALFDSMELDQKRRGVI